MSPLHFYVLLYLLTRPNDYLRRVFTLQYCETYATNDKLHLRSFVSVTKFRFLSTTPHCIYNYLAINSVAKIFDQKELSALKMSYWQRMARHLLAYRMRKRRR